MGKHEGSHQSPPFLSFENVGMQFGKSDSDVVLEDVSFSLGKGELMALIGPSGCGKSTLLNIVAGLVKPTTGQATLAEQDARIAYVFQRPRLLPWRKVKGNVRFGIENRGEKLTSSTEEAIKRAISLVHLDGHEDKYPHELSGGMQQRVALARGLAIEPSLFLLDEPFGALDALTRTYLQEELLGLVRRTGTTTLLVTHDIDEALLLADRVAVMSVRPGGIKAIVDTPFGTNRSLDDLMANPAYAEIRSRLREMLRHEVDEVVDEVP